MNIALQGLFPEELRDLVQQTGFPPFRAKQLWHWLHLRHAFSWAEMTNLPRPFLDALSTQATPSPLTALRTSGDPGSTQKWLLELDDGETLETVLIPSRDRQTVCVSTQVGCKMACAFCASGKGGWIRNLSAGEIVAQVHYAARQLGHRPDNVVFMGMGEPFDNYDNVLRAVRLLNHPDGLNIGARKITLSTSGLIPGIRRLATEGLQVELSVSLHAPSPDLRRRLMPVETAYPMTALLAACRDYTAATRRIITFEYTLIRGVNDSPAHAEQLAARLSTFPCRVNAIPLSPVAEFQEAAPSRETCQTFLDILARRHIPATLRESKGKSLSAACGQLRCAVAQPPPPPPKKTPPQD